MADDFIDFNGSKKLAGKSTKKDLKKGKSTLISLLGYEKANSYALQLKKNILSLYCLPENLHLRLNKKDLIKITKLYDIYLFDCN